ncbi:substrate-binding periplasmic protein [Kordiimonas sp.]|uniref:substrate-binding periplasmic protein n=1 Tax=Kordiimonas sp. TaxID=1970157 RepID=UPI003A8F1B6B
MTASIFGSLTCSASPADAACERELNVVYFNSAPYHHRNGDGQVVGLDTDILEQVLRKAGCTWRYTEMPLKRSLSALRSGLVDIAMGASITPDREEYAFFSQPYRREVMVMFMRKNDEPRASFQRLANAADAGVVIGAHLGSWYGYEYARLYENDSAFRRQILQSANYDTLYNALLAGRVDVVIDDIFNGHTLLSKSGRLEEASIHVSPVNDSLTHFMLSKKSVSDKTMNSLDHAIMAFQQSEAYAETIARYVPADYLSRYPILSASPAIIPQSLGAGATTLQAR